jgi:polysaccharide export outer membrane protein
MRPILLAIALTSSTLLIGSALAQEAGNSPALPQPRAESAGSYILGPGDQIVVRAANAPELSEKQTRIDLNGFVNLPMAGRIKAAGLTIEEFEGEIAQRLKVYLEEPDVSVNVAEYQGQPVSIFGEVNTPGVQQVQGRRTLVEILAMAGGVRPEAGPVVRITRRIEQGRIPLPGAKDDPSGRFSIADVELKPLIEAKTPEKDIAIKADDVISVPKAEMVFISGDVNKAGALPLSDGRTVSISEALASSGGILKTAAPQKARILRLPPGGSSREQLPVDVAKILNGKADDVQLGPGDILYIPGSAAKKASVRAIEAAVQAGTVILTYGVIR